MVPFAGSLGKLGNHGNVLLARKGFLCGVSYEMDSLEECFFFPNPVLAGLCRR